MAEFKSMSALLSLAIQTQPGGLMSVIERADAEARKEKVDIQEVIDADGTPTIVVSCKGLSWQVKTSDIPSQSGHEQLRWYLEDFQLSPLDSAKAEPVSRGLAGYGRTLFNALGLGQLWEAFEESPSTLIINVQHPAHESKVPGMLWESLEETGLWSADGLHATQAIVRRASRGKPKIRARARQSFNILYVVARPGTNIDKYIDYRLLSKSVVQTIDAIKRYSAEVQLQIVRPGTWEALYEHLAEARSANGGQQGYYDLVHFDMHGQYVCDAKGERYQLAFLNADTGEEKFVDARRVALLLSRHDIPAVLLNTCESAITARGGDSNLARVLIQHGVAFVTAMSFKLSTSAAELFIEAFYKTLLDDAPNYNAAVKAGRDALRARPMRMARFGLTVPVQDWTVPVLYTDTANVVVMMSRTRSDILTGYTLEGTLYSPLRLMSPDRAKYELERMQSAGAKHSVEPPFQIGQLDPGFVGRDFEIMWIETLLCRKPGNALRVYGPPGIGKTFLLNQLGAWWTRTFFASYVSIISCQAEDCVARLEEHLADRWALADDGTLRASPEGIGIMSGFGLMDRPPILILDDLDSLEDPAVSGNGDRLRKLCQVLPQFRDGRTRLVFISRKHTLPVETAEPGSGLSRIIGEADVFELRPFSPPDAAAFGSRLLQDKGETVPRQSSDVNDLQRIYEGVDNIADAIRMIMTECSFLEESKHPRKMVEKMRKGTACIIVSPPVRTEVHNILADGGGDMQIASFFLSPFSQVILDEESHQDLLEYLSWPVQHEGFMPHVGLSQESIDVVRRVIAQHGSPAEYSDALTDDSIARFYAQRYALLRDVLEAINAFISAGFIVARPPASEKDMPTLWLHPMLTAILREALERTQPQLQVRFDRSFVHFMIKKLFSAESWASELRFVGHGIPQDQTSLMDFVRRRFHRQPWNYVRAFVLGFKFIDEIQMGEVVVTLLDYLRALSLILRALDMSRDREWVEVLRPLVETVLDDHLLKDRQDPPPKRTLGDEELKSALSMLRYLATFEMQLRRSADTSIAVRYLQKASAIGLRHRLGAAAQAALDEITALLRMLQGDPGPGAIEGAARGGYIGAGQLTASSRHAEMANDEILQHFRTYLMRVQADFRDGWRLSTPWEQEFLESLDVERTDDEFGKIALAYGRYLDHDNNGEFSKVCFSVESSMVDGDYAAARETAMKGLESALDSSNRYGEYDFRRYLVAIAELSSEEDISVQLEHLALLADNLRFWAGEWCGCWRAVVHAERCIARHKYVEARASYLRALRVSCVDCSDGSHFDKVTGTLIDQDIWADATLLFLNFCRQQSTARESYDPGDFDLFLKSLLEPQPEWEYFAGSVVFLVDAEALRDLQTLSGLTTNALLEPLIRCYLKMLQAFVQGDRVEDSRPGLALIARAEQLRLFSGHDPLSTGASSMTSGPTFTVTIERFSTWVSKQMESTGLHADGIHRKIPSSGRFAFLKYGIIADTDLFIPVIDGGDSDTSDNEAGPGLPQRRGRVPALFDMCKSCFARG